MESELIRLGGFLKSINSPLPLDLQSKKGPDL
ncbi:hypothetical protein EDF60_0046 [Leucobacter luti]|nr:hypothetical protein [Leucobacter luti]TCK44835.1 hypothetical protein EDF60_0046 [Leucobacter luti]